MESPQGALVTLHFDHYAWIGWEPAAIFETQGIVAAVSCGPTP